MNDNYRHAQRQLGSLYDARRHIIGNLLPSRRLQKAEERRKEEVDSCRYLTRVIVVDHWGQYRVARMEKSHVVGRIAGDLREHCLGQTSHVCNILLAPLPRGHTLASAG